MLSLSSSFATGGDITGINIMKLVSKTENELVFEVAATHSYGAAHIWEYFGAPFELPRTLLEYTEE